MDILSRASSFKAIVHCGDGTNALCDDTYQVVIYYLPITLWANISGSRKDREDTLPAKKTIFIQSSIDSYSEGLIDEWSWKPSEKNFTYYSDEYKMIIRYHFA